MVGAKNVTATLPLLSVVPPDVAATGLDPNLTERAEFGVYPVPNIVTAVPGAPVDGLGVPRTRYVEGVAHCV
jgi:hypothetical protein